MNLSRLTRETGTLSGIPPRLTFSQLNRPYIRPLIDLKCLFQTRFQFVCHLHGLHQQPTRSPLALIEHRHMGRWQVYFNFSLPMSFPVTSCRQACPISPTMSCAFWAFVTGTSLRRQLWRARRSPCKFTPAIFTAAGGSRCSYNPPGGASDTSPGSPQRAPRNVLLQRPQVLGPNSSSIVDNSTDPGADTGFFGGDRTPPPTAVCSLFCLLICPGPCNNLDPLLKFLYEPPPSESWIRA